MIKLYSPENVERARFAQIAVTILAVGISAYLGYTAFSGVRDVWGARSVLTAARLESGQLSRQAAAMKRDEATRPKRNDGGVDVLALEFSRWANEQGVKVESIAPQGAPTSSDITIDSASLGSWNAVKVRVEGYGDFAGVCGLINKLRRPGMPVQLESFAFQGASGDDSDRISFDLMLTVYGRKTDAT
jgi:hypothetical protein